MDPLVGRTLGRHRLEQKLGGGGFGDVYRATHLGLDQVRAVKVLAPDRAREDTSLRLFLREARLAAGLRHPHIVQIHDVAEDNGYHYIAMELLEGRSLHELLREEGPQSLSRALGLLDQLADALDYAHGRGVLHRDIKPSNIIVGPNDHVTLVDFGIARAAESTGMTYTQTVGTPFYMAPEVWKGAPATPSVDLYALGVLSYELLVGRVPFAGPTTAAIMHDHIYTPPPQPRALRPDIPEPIEVALLRQLAKAPDDRYPSAGAFVAALSSAAHAHDVRARAEAVRAAEAARLTEQARAALDQDQLDEADRLVDALHGIYPHDPIVGELRQTVTRRRAQLIAERKRRAEAQRDAATTTAREGESARPAEAAAKPPARDDVELLSSTWLTRKLRVTLAGRPHVVEVKNRAFAGEEVVFVDGEPVFRERNLANYDRRYDFQIADGPRRRAISIAVRYSPWTVQMLGVHLTVDGALLYSEGQPLRGPQEARATYLRAYLLSLLIMLTVAGLVFWYFGGLWS